MLYAITGGGDLRLIAEIPRAETFEGLRGRLSVDQFDAVLSELDRRLDGKEVDVSSWMPGANWAGTVFDPLCEVACRGDRDLAAKFFGLIAWYYFMRRPDDWSFKGSDADDDFRGTVYYRIDVRRKLSR